jgi:DNA-binding response OmpR family regulator
VLLDVMMPGIDGPTTLQRLRKIPGFEDVPVVFMTAKVQPDEIRRWHELGAVDVFEKPFDPMSLAARVGEVLGRAKRMGAA